MLTLLVYGYVDADVYVCDLVSPSLFDEAPCICTHVLDVQFRKCLLTDEDSHMDIHWHVSQEKRCGVQWIQSIYKCGCELPAMRTHEYADFLPPSYEKTVLYQIVNMMPTFPGDTGGVPSP